MSFLNEKMSYFLILVMFFSLLVFQNQNCSWEWGSGSSDDTVSTGSTGSTGTDSDE